LAPEEKAEKKEAEAIVSGNYLLTEDAADKDEAT